MNKTILLAAIAAAAAQSAAAQVETSGDPRLTRRGWEVSLVATARGDNVWSPEFARLTPDLFVLGHFLRPVDQALFVRRDVFVAIGGYADIPIMEDVDLVRRLRAKGRLLRSPLPAVTSARRWEEDGWGRRTARHLALIVRYLAGTPPERLVRLDPGRNRSRLYL